MAALSQDQREGKLPLALTALILVGATALAHSDSSKHDVPYLRSSPQSPSARSLLFSPLPINILLLFKVRGQLPDPQQGQGLSALVLMAERPRFGVRAIGFQSCRLAL